MSFSTLTRITVRGSGARNKFMDLLMHIYGFDPSRWAEGGTGEGGGDYGTPERGDI